jgi:hypothetical protein
MHSKNGKLFVKSVNLLSISWCRLDSLPIFPNFRNQLQQSLYLTIKFSNSSMDVGNSLAYYFIALKGSRFSETRSSSQILMTKTSARSKYLQVLILDRLGSLFQNSCIVVGMLEPPDRIGSIEFSVRYPRCGSVLRERSIQQYHISCDYRYCPSRPPLRSGPCGSNKPRSSESLLCLSFLDIRTNHSLILWKSISLSMQSRNLKCVWDFTVSKKWRMSEMSVKSCELKDFEPHMTEIDYKQVFILNRFQYCWYEPKAWNHHPLGLPRSTWTFDGFNLYFLFLGMAQHESFQYYSNALIIDRDINVIDRENHALGNVGRFDRTDRHLNRPVPLN